MHPDPRSLQEKALTNRATRTHAWVRRGIAKRLYDQATGEDWEALYLRALYAREVVREGAVLGHTGQSQRDWEERAARANGALYAALERAMLPVDRLRGLGDWEQALAEDGGQDDDR